MSIKKIPKENRVITLQRWSIIEVEIRGGLRSRHICGHDVENDAGRATSAIKQFFKDTMVAVTQNGSFYRLAGMPGYSEPARFVWSRVCRNNKVVTERDVSHEYVNTI
jgi:hypothetical protein